jgi:hypothetical protein
MFLHCLSALIHALLPPWPGGTEKDGGEEKGMKRGDPPKEVTVVGRVHPRETDNEGTVIGIRIATDEGDLVVDINELGQELFDFLDEKVRATGTVRIERNGKRKIRVTDYEVVEEADEGGESD